MARIKETPLECIREFIIASKVLDYQTQIGSVKDIHDLMYAGINGLVQKIFFEKVFNLKSEIAQDHWQSKIFKAPGSGM
jgi:hypothetical protein